MRPNASSRCSAIGSAEKGDDAVSPIADLVVRLRTSAPPPVRTAIDAALAAERGPIAWLKERMLVRGDIPPTPHPITDRPTRVLIAPMNYAGQGREWARTLDGADVEATNLAVRAEASRAAATDWAVTPEVFTASRTWRARQRAALTKFTHVMIESFVSPLGRGTGAVVRDDIAWLTQRGVRLALLCHGTDVRRPREHMRTHPHSPFQALSPAALAAAERSAEVNVGIAASFTGPVFVSTPDLLHDVPSARWLPVVVEPRRWASDHPVTRSVPRVLHAPSSVGVKGTEHVERAAHALTESGAIEYVPLRDIPAAQMPDHVGRVDIVIDQLLLGSYGVAACEALAAGRVVIGNVDDDVRAHVRAETGLDLPIVQADVDTLETVLARLAADPAERARIASRGPCFVAQVHAGSRTRAVLADYLSTAAG